jgi:hypothetical protein
MPQKAALTTAADDRKKAKSGSERKSGERIKIPVRKAPEGAHPVKLLTKDDDYKLKVGEEGNSGTYLVIRIPSEESIEFSVKRLSDYDTTDAKNKDGKKVGRRPRPSTAFEKFQDIVQKYKGKNETWIDGDSPLAIEGYRDEDMIKNPFIYRSAKEVWPGKVSFLSSSWKAKLCVTSIYVCRISNLKSPMELNPPLIPGMLIRSN